MKASTRLMQTPDLELPPARTVNPELYRGSTVHLDSRPCPRIRSTISGSGTSAARRGSLA